MKKLVFVFSMLFVVFMIGGVSVKADAPSYNFDEMLLSIQDVLDAEEEADGDELLLANILAEKGYENFAIGESTEVSGRYSIFGHLLTEDEIELLMTHLLLIDDWINCATLAINTTADLYGSTADGSIPNSFQHAYWNVLMTKYLGIDLAEDFAVAHENWDENPILHKNMDLYNNEQGRIFADTISDIENESDEDLATMTQSLVTSGVLKYILFDYEYVSVYIYTDFGIEFEYETADLYAYTDSTLPIYLPDYEIRDERSNPGGPKIMPMSIIGIELVGVEGETFGEVE